MFVEQVYLSDFRNYETGNVKFKDGTNVIYGANARGKTNILESIYIMSTSRSHRGSKEAEMIRFGQNSAKIAAKFHSHGRVNKAEIDFFNDKKKRIKINGVVADKTSQLMGYLNTVIFCPEDLKLVKGSPGIPTRAIFPNRTPVRVRSINSGPCSRSHIRIASATTVVSSIAS